MSEIREHRNTTYPTCEIWAGAADSRPEFFEHAACKGMTSVMYPEGRGYNPYRDAKAICRRCPVILACREWALDTGELMFGMFGGLTPAQRQNLLYQRGRVSRASTDARRLGMTCRSGHPWTPENTLQGKRQRQCRQCMHVRYERLKERRRGQ